MSNEYEDETFDPPATIRTVLRNGETVALSDNCIPAEWAIHLFARDGVVAEVVAF